MDDLRVLRNFYLKLRMGLVVHVGGLILSFQSMGAMIRTFGSAVVGVNALAIEVEVDAQKNAIGYFLVGLPDNAVKEGQHRIETAMRNAGVELKRYKYVVNMAPADIRKEGAAYDLTIAAGLLAASEQMMGVDLERYVIMGELSLDGSIKPIKGALPMAIQARKEGYKGMLLPLENAREAAIVTDLEVYGLQHLRELVDFFNGKQRPERIEVNTREAFYAAQDAYEVDFSDVKGQENIKRAMEVAAAGGHNVLLVGPPGAGKTMLSKRLPTILPPLTLHEALETTKIHSVAGKLPNREGLVSIRPFRSPHHTISDVALVGGGGHPQPGEISLAHNGVLFLDELPEFKRTVLEVMRQPLEERRVTISRARFTVDYPASFMLVASMNPCPCGFYNHPDKECTCGSQQVQRYLSRVSGPLLDRIDIHIEVVPVSFNELSNQRPAESSSEVRARVMRARERQLARFEGQSIYSNAQMPHNQLHQWCAVNSAGQMLLKTAMERLGLSARAYDRILKVARTIADLGDSDHIQAEHLAEAIQYRSLDRSNWGA